jgi:hypothetical protein
MTLFDVKMTLFDVKMALFDVKMPVFDMKMAIFKNPKLQKSIDVFYKFYFPKKLTKKKKKNPNKTK